MLADYVVHYNDHRPHRALEQQAPLAGGGRVRRQSVILTSPDHERTDKLGGLIHEYELAA